MHASGTEWLAGELPLVVGPRICELGSYDENGSPRRECAVLKPAHYLGVDIRPGPAVDRVADACSGALAETYETWDIVISTETLEHVQSWQTFVREMKRLARPGGHLLLTCRSPGFRLHDYPGDYWRFTTEDIASAFEDCEIVTIQDDPAAPGVFLHATRPHGWSDRPLPYTEVTTPHDNTA